MSSRRRRGKKNEPLVRKRPDKLANAVVPAPPSDKELLQAFAEFGREWNRRSDRYRQHVESIQSLPPLEKAEAWLAHFAEHGDEWGDQEALVYLRSRGHTCSREIEDLIGTWKRAEIEVIKRCAEGRPVWSLDKPVRTLGGMSLSEASDVRKLSPYLLRDFWSGADQQEFTIDATMLRTAEWCEIGGFSQWWERLANEFYTSVLRGGVEPVPASYLLFNFCRSDYARRLMPQALETVLRAMEIGDHDPDAPWKVFASFRPAPGLMAHLGYASTLAFAQVILRAQTERGDTLMANAAEELLRHQRADGAWSTWAEDPNPSIGTTAMALHALAVGKPFGWERSVEQGEKWLWQAQHEEGYWRDEQDPDPTYLTVLVLDAIALGQGRSRVTFGIPGLTSSRSGDPSSVSGAERRFLVALSFPGEVRPEIAKVADLLAKELGRTKVFYDAYHTAELARINLDVHLQSIYRDQSLLVVPFICADYDKKEWCGLEWRAIRAIIKEKRDDQVMPIRLDDTELPGLFSIDGYIDFRDHTPDEVTQLILERVRSRQGRN